MKGTFESLLRIPPFAPSGLEPSRRRRARGHPLFRTWAHARAAPSHELTVGFLLVAAYAAVLVTYLASLH